MTLVVPGKPSPKTGAMGKRSGFSATPGEDRQIANDNRLLSFFPTNESPDSFFDVVSSHPFQNTQMKETSDDDDEDDAKKIERPDVSERIRRRKTLVEQCVKCTLPTRLAPGWDSKARDSLRDNLERQIQGVSEITVRGSLLVNEVLLHCLRTNRPLPSLNASFFNACFLQGLKQSTRQSKSDFSVVWDVFENEFYDYPIIERNRGDCQAITIAAARYGANFKTSVLYSFLARQRGFISTWIAEQQRMEKEEHEKREKEMIKNLEVYRASILQMQYDPEGQNVEDEIPRQEDEIKRGREMYKNRQTQWKEVSAFAVQCAINGWKNGSERRTTRKRKRDDDDSEAPQTPDQVLTFIERERALLGHPKNFQITDKTDVGLLLRYIFHVLEFYRAHGVGKGFSIAPICKIKRHFMTIDTTVLYELLKNVATEIGPAFPEALAPIRTVPLKHLFNACNAGLVDAMWRLTFDLDGLRRRRTFGRQIDTDGVSMVAHFHVTLRQRSKHAKRLRQRQHASHQNLAPRVIAIDPGRSNLVTALDSATSRVTTLTRREYYGRAGIAKAKVRVAHWELPLRGVVASLTKTSVRTSSARMTYAYRQILVRNYDRLWEHRTARKRAKSALTVYAGKQHALDGFFANLKAAGNDGRPVVVAYGAATFHPAGKGEVSVPVKRVLQVCRRHLPTVMVNEHLTTKVHHACHQRLNPVSRPLKRRFPIRGLCYCQNCSKFVSRDGNAARNILRVYRSMALGHARPPDLRFGQPRQTREVLPRVVG